MGESSGNLYFAPGWLIPPGEERLVSWSARVVSAVIFDDGSYEGNPIYAAQLAEHQIGAQIQFERIRHLVDEILARSADEEGRSTLIQAEVRKLDSAGAPWMVELVRKEFPSLSSPITRDEKREGGGVLHSGLSSMKSYIINELEDFKKLETFYQPASRPSLDKWWDHEKQKYDGGWGEMSIKVIADISCPGCGGHSSPTR
jgi:hypothetical protein